MSNTIPELARDSNGEGLVAIAIVSYRSAELVGHCLSHLAGSSYRNFAVHVVENGGSDAYAALVAAVEKATSSRATAVAAPAEPRTLSTRMLILQPRGQPVFLHQASGNLGYAGGVNVALAEARANCPLAALWVLNPDTTPQPDALRALAVHAASGAYGVVGSRLVVSRSGRIQLYGGRWRRWMARGYNIGLGAPADAPVDTAAVEGQLDYVAGASMYATPAFLAAAGPMEERYFLYNEEIDWCFRRGELKLGYAHDSVILHDHGAIIGSNTSRRSRSALSVYLDERNKLLFTRRFYATIYPAVALSTLVLTLQYVKAGAFANFRMALLGWLAGLRGETGIPRRFGGPG